MSKNDIVQGLFRDKRNMSRFTDMRGQKVHKSRYERRKVKAVLRHTEWLDEFDE